MKLSRIISNQSINNNNFKVHINNVVDKPMDNSMVKKLGEFPSFYNNISFKGESEIELPIADFKVIFKESLEEIKKEPDDSKKIEIFLNSQDKYVEKFTSSFPDKIKKSEKEMLGDCIHETSGPMVVLYNEAFISLLRNDKINFDFDKRVQNLYKNTEDTLNRYQFFVDNNFDAHNHSINKVFNMSLESLEDTIKEKNLTLKIKINKNLKHFQKKKINTNLTNYKLYTVMNNLIANAVKYTPKNGSININCGLNKEKDNIEFSIKDTGIGIPKDEIDKVLQGNRASNALLSEIPGTGYGLPRVYKIVTSDFGSSEALKIKSKVNEGTEISCKFKLKD